jgi:hypothetical protein
VSELLAGKGNDLLFCQLVAVFEGDEGARDLGREGGREKGRKEGREEGKQGGREGRREAKRKSRRIGGRRRGRGRQGRTSPHLSQGLATTAASAMEG